jgi:hypothetical protein
MKEGMRKRTEEKRMRGGAVEYPLWMVSIAQCL